MKYWEIIGDELSGHGWSWGLTTVLDARARRLFVVDARKDHLCGRFVVRSDELLTAFLELHRAVTTATAAELKPGMTVSITLGIDPSKASRIIATGK